MNQKWKWKLLGSSLWNENHFPAGIISLPSFSACKCCFTLSGVPFPAGSAACRPWSEHPKGLKSLPWAWISLPGKASFSFYQTEICAKIQSPPSCVWSGACQALVTLVGFMSLEVWGAATPSCPQEPAEPPPALGSCVLLPSTSLTRAAPGLYLWPGHDVQSK